MYIIPLFTQLLTEWFYFVRNISIFVQNKSVLHLSWYIFCLDMLIFEKKNFFVEERHFLNNVYFLIYIRFWCICKVYNINIQSSTEAIYKIMYYMFITCLVFKSLDTQAALMIFNLILSLLNLSPFNYFPYCCISFYSFRCIPYEIENNSVILFEIVFTR